MSWTDERIERLKELWSKGMTASQIADELGGVSRNAVIGKAHRLGLQSRPSPVRPNDTSPAAVQEEKRRLRKKRRLHRRRRRRLSRPRRPPRLSNPQRQPEREAAAPEPRIVSVGPGGFLRQTPHEQQAPIPLLRPAAWCRPSRAPRLPARRACSISTSGSASGRSAIRASPTSTSAASPPIRDLLRRRSLRRRLSGADAPARPAATAAAAARRPRVR